MAAKADALVIGPGMMNHDATAAFLTALFERMDRGPVLVLDAGAISTLNGSGALLSRHAGRLVLTPHAGEMATLVDEDRNTVLREPLRFAREAALWGVYLHGEAGNVLAARQGRIGFLARELSDELPALMEKTAGR